MKSFSRVLLLTIVANAVAVAVYAQETDNNSDSTDDPNALEEIEVFAGAIADTGRVEHREYSGSYTSIDKQTLERRDISIADILSHQTGVQSRQSGGFGTFSSITVRAASAAQTGIYLDGILLNSGGNAVIDLSLLDLLNVDAVDVYRGVTPAQFGRGTIGGAINLSSSGAEPGELQNTVGLGVASFETTGLQFSHRSRHGLLDVVSAFSLKQSENNYRFTDSNGTPLNPNDDTRQRRNNAAVQRVSALARAGFQWSPASRTDVLAQATSREQGIPETRNAPDNQASLDSDAMRLQLSHTIDDLGNWNSRHTLFLHDDYDLFDDRLGQIGLGIQFTESAATTLGFRTYWEHIGLTRTSGISLEARRETQDTNDEINEEFNFVAERQALNASLSTTLYFKDDRLIVTPLLQTQINDDNFERVTPLMQSTRREQVITPQLGARLELNDGLFLRANVGRFYREPSFGELFGNRGLIRGNIDLQPEEGINADLGFNWLPGNTVSIDVSLFASWRDELISTVFDARRVGRTLNVGAARIVGLEFAGDWQLNKEWSALANFTIQDARSVDVFSAFEDQQLPGEAQQTAYVRLQYKRKAWRAFIEGDGSWNRFYDQANVLPARDQWLQNIGVDWQHQGFKISASINNFSDQNVEDFGGFPRPGRSFSLFFSKHL